RRSVLAVRKERSSGESELRAYLQELRAPPVAQYELLALIATGGDPDHPSTAHEWANYQPLTELLLVLVRTPDFAPQIERGKNLEGQLFLLQPDEISRASQLIWEHRYPTPDQAR